MLSGKLFLINYLFIIISFFYMENIMLEARDREKNHNSYSNILSSMQKDKKTKIEM